MTLITHPINPTNYQRDVRLHTEMIPWYVAHLLPPQVKNIPKKDIKWRPWKELQNVFWYNVSVHFSLISLKR